MNRRVEFFLCFLALFLDPASAQKKSKNPCHNKGAEKEGGCKNIVMPQGLCSACDLKAPDANGNFKDCTSIYDIDSQCVNKLQEYVNLNECDSRRKQVLENYKSNKNKNESKKGLDYFIYAMCEQCCDLVAKGSQKKDYKSTTAKERFSIKRGNGAAHYHYDVCKVLPNIQSISLHKDERDLKKKKRKKKKKNKKPKKIGGKGLCGHFKNWMKSPYSNNWIGNFNIKSTGIIDDALMEFMDAVQCDKQDVWEKCVNLEAAQNRI